jgi:very-short-patch-repair endonuclease
MDVATLLHHLGGACDRQSLLTHVSRSEVERALEAGRIVRDGRGRYALPRADRARRAANALNGVVSHRSAALHWGWRMKTVPDKPDVLVPRNRKHVREWEAALHWGSLTSDEIEGDYTSQRRTITDCMRGLPFDEALSIADSSLRMRSFQQPTLMELAAEVKGTGAPQARRVAAEASGEADNPFESVLRAISLDVAGLRLVPQVVLAEGPVLRPDLVDESLRLVVEAESFEWHGERSQLVRDCKRYTRLTLLGWWVMRFSWEAVMLNPDYVRACLEEFVRVGRSPAEPLRCPVHQSA